MTYMQGVIADLVNTIGRSIAHIESGAHDPVATHDAVKTMYSWDEVAESTDQVYQSAMQSARPPLIERIRRCAPLVPCPR